VGKKSDAFESDEKQISLNGGDNMKINRKIWSGGKKIILDGLSGICKGAMVRNDAYKINLGVMFIRGAHFICYARQWKEINGE